MFKMRLNLLLLCVLILLSGCAVTETGDTVGTEGTMGTEGGSQEADYRTEFTDSELAEGYASFAVSEHLVVDAEITPYDKYADGLNSYYMTQCYEEGDVGDAESFLEEATIFGRQQDEFWELFSDASGVGISRSILEYGMTESYGYAFNEGLTGENGLGYFVLMNWMSFGAGVWEPHAYYPMVSLVVSEEDNPAVQGSYDTYIMKSVLDYGGELAFADSTSLAAELKGTLEELTGRRISDVWDCVAVTNEAVSTYAALEDGFEEYYCFYFYYDLDGLGIEDLSLSYEMQDGESCTDGARYSTLDESSVLVSLNEVAQVVAVGESGILWMQISSGRDKGGVYKEGLSVVPPSELLATVKEYYDTQLLVEDVTITQVRLVYSGYFTDGADGEIDNAFRPFWKVQAYDANEGSRRTFVFDAVSGELLSGVS